MRLLDAVRLDKPADDELTSSPRSEGSDDCPNCGGKLGTAAWCGNCAYCPKLGRVMTRTELLEAMQPDVADSPTAPWRRLIALPIGIVAIVILSLIARNGFTDPAARSGLAILQAVLGVMCLAIAHLRAVLLVAQKQGHVSLATICLSPGEIWGPIFRRLPKSSALVTGGVWSASAIVTALFIIGVDWAGLLGSLAGQPQAVNPLRALVRSVAASEGSVFGAERKAPADLSGKKRERDVSTNGDAAAPNENALQEFAEAAGADQLAQTESGSSTDEAAANAPLDSDSEDTNAADADMRALAAFQAASVQDLATTFVLYRSPGPAPKTANGEVRGEENQFVVFGFLTNAQGELRSILLAEVASQRERSQGRFVSKFLLDDLSAADRVTLRAALDRYRVSRPLLPTPYRAMWVSAVVTCRVAYTGWSADGQLKDGYLLSMEAPELVQSGKNPATESRRTR